MILLSIDDVNYMNMKVDVCDLTTTIGQGKMRTDFVCFSSLENSFVIGILACRFGAYARLWFKRKIGWFSKYAVMLFCVFYMWFLLINNTLIQVQLIFHQEALCVVFLIVLRTKSGIRVIWHYII